MRGCPEEFRRAIGRRLKSKRLAAGWSLDRLSDYARLTKAFLWGVEQGRQQPTAYTLLALSEALEVSIDWIVKGK